MVPNEHYGRDWFEIGQKCVFLNQPFSDNILFLDKPLCISCNNEESASIVDVVDLAYIIGQMVTNKSSMKWVLSPHHPPLTPLSQIPFTPGIVGFPGK